MKLLIKNREVTGKKVKLLRQKGLVPCIVYGKHMDKALNVTCNKNELLKLYAKVGTSQPFDVEFEDGKKEMVLIHDYQLHPVTDYLLHVDFLVLTKGEKTTAEISINFVGESEVEKKKLGRIQIVKDAVSVEALPKDLPKDFEVDISVIKTNNDVIFVKDLECPKGVEILDDLEVPLITVASLGGDEDKEETAEENVTEEGAIEEETAEKKATEKKE